MLANWASTELLQTLTHHRKVCEPEPDTFLERVYQCMIILDSRNIVLLSRQVGWGWECVM